MLRSVAARARGAAVRYRWCAGTCDQSILVPSCSSNSRLFSCPQALTADPSRSRFSRPSIGYDTVNGYAPGGIRSFLTGSGSDFDPSQLSKSFASILKPPESELSPLEINLRRAIKLSQQEDPASQHTLESLQNAFQELEYFDEALKVETYICSEFYSNDEDAYAKSIHTQGKLQLRMQDFRESKKLYDKALELYTALGNEVQRGHVLMSISGWHFFRQELDDSLRLLLESEPMLEAHPTLLIKNLDNQGLVYRSQGEFSEALKKYRQALKLVPNISSKSKPDDLNTTFDDLRRTLQMHIADMLRELDRPEEALALYQTILETVDDSEYKSAITGVVLHEIGTLYADAGDLESALNSFVTSLQHQQIAVNAVGVKSGADEVSRVRQTTSPPMVDTYVSIGALLGDHSDNIKEAKEAFQRALIIARAHSSTPEHEDDPTVKMVLQNLHILESRGKEEGTEKSKNDE